MTTLEELVTKEKPQWCAGCGNFSTHIAIKSVLAELSINPHETVIVSGIGCGGKVPHYVNCYGFESLHGRPLACASGIKLANHKLTVIAVGGDGDGYGIGIQHFIHIMRRNYDLSYIVHNNQIYGLTTGQASPTTMKGMKSKSTPHGILEVPFNPIAVAITNGATYVSRAFAGDIKHMAELIKGAIAHKGFAVVDVLQPCVTFNKLNSYEWFKQRVYKLDECGHDPSDKMKALEKAFEQEKTNYEKMPIGLFYKEELPTYESQLPQLKEKSLIAQNILNIDISKTCEEFK